MAGRIKAILFDKDGTLIDFNGTWLTLYEKLALEAADGDEVKAAYLLKIGGHDPLSGTFLAGSELAAGTTDSIVRLWFEDCPAHTLRHWKARLDRAFVEDAPAFAVPVPDLETTLIHLHGQGRLLGVVTNDLQAAAERTIQLLGVRGYFSAVLGYDSVKNPKPAADPVHLACSILGIQPHEVAMVGDNLHDLETARNAGAGAAIGVLTGNSTHTDLAHKADVVLPSIADLPEWLAGVGR
jgi:phosphoglycolate phosphatase